MDYMKLAENLLVNYPQYVQPLRGYKYKDAIGFCKSALIRNRLIDDISWSKTVIGFSRVCSNYPSGEDFASYCSSGVGHVKEVLKAAIFISQNLTIEDCL